MNRFKYGCLIGFLLICCAAQKPPTTSLYDEKADARRDVAAAIASAEGSQRNIVLIFGANW